MRARAFSSVTVVVTRLVLVRNSQTSERSSHDDGRNQDLTGLSLRTLGGTPDRDPCSLWGLIWGLPRDIEVI